MDRNKETLAHTGTIILQAHAVAGQTISFVVGAQLDTKYILSSLFNIDESYKSINAISRIIFE
jgi:hypothetical protein